VSLDTRCTTRRNDVEARPLQAENQPILSPPVSAAAIRRHAAMTVNLLSDYWDMSHFLRGVLLKFASNVHELSTFNDL
jgi:hypothetical protein